MRKHFQANQHEVAKCVGEATAKARILRASKQSGADAVHAKRSELKPRNWNGVDKTEVS